MKRATWLTAVYTLLFLAVVIIVVHAMTTGDPT